MRLWASSCRTTALSGASWPAFLAIASASGNRRSSTSELYSSISIAIRWSTSPRWARSRSTCASTWALCLSRASSARRLPVDSSMSRLVRSIRRSIWVFVSAGSGWSSRPFAVTSSRSSASAGDFWESRFASSCFAATSAEMRASRRLSAAAASAGAGFGLGAASLGRPVWLIASSIILRAAAASPGEPPSGAGSSSAAADPQVHPQARASTTAATRRPGEAVSDRHGPNSSRGRVTRGIHGVLRAGNEPWGGRSTRGRHQGSRPSRGPESPGKTGKIGRWRRLSRGRASRPMRSAWPAAARLTSRPCRAVGRCGRA